MLCISSSLHTLRRQRNTIIRPYHHPRARQPERTPKKSSAKGPIVTRYYRSKYLRYTGRYSVVQRVGVCKHPDIYLHVCFSSPFLFPTLDQGRQHSRLFICPCTGEVGSKHISGTFIFSLRGIRVLLFHVYSACRPASQRV